MFQVFFCNGHTDKANVRKTDENKIFMKKILSRPLMSAKNCRCCRFLLQEGKCFGI
jgi:hypothetical protein